jgi:hypothetical protein
MITRWKYQAVLAILLLSACSKPPASASQETTSTGETEIVQAFVSSFTEPSQVSANLDDFLTGTVGLEGVSVEYKGENLAVNFDQPYGIQAHQLKLLYTSILVTAQSYAPLCDQIEMTIKIDSEPFVTLTADCDSVTSYQRDEINVNDLYNGMALSVPITETSQVAPVPTEELTRPTPTAVPTPNDQVLLGGINLIGVRLRQNVFENWQIIGVAANDGKYAVEGLKLLMEVKNAEGEIVYSNEHWLANEYLTPGEASAFIQYLPSDVREPAEAQVTVLEGSYNPWLLDFPALEIEGARIVPGYELGSVSIVGEVYNPHDQAVMLYNITGVATDSEGLPIATSIEGKALLYISPGERIPFVLPFEPLTSAERDALVDAYVYLDGVFVEQRNPLPIRFGEGVRHYYDDDGQSHIVGMLWNEGDDTVMVELVGTLRDAQGATIDNTKDQAPFFYVPPKAVLPFDINNWNVDRQLVQDNAASFEVAVDPGRGVLNDEHWRLVPLPVDLLSAETGSTAHITGKMGSIDQDLSNLDSMVVIASAWADDGQSLLGMAWSSVSTNADPDWEFHLYIPMDVQNLDPATVTYDMVLYGLERLD